jgi:hypothetical protein
MVAHRAAAEEYDGKERVEGGDQVGLVAGAMGVGEGEQSDEQGEGHRVTQPTPATPREECIVLSEPGHLWWGGVGCGRLSWGRRGHATCGH